MTTRLRHLLAVIGVLAITPVLAGQAPAPIVRILSPTADDILVPGTTLEADVQAAGRQVQRVAFFVDGMPACAATTPPYRCQWQATIARGARDVRVVVEFVDGSRTIATLRAKASTSSFHSAVDSVMVPVQVRDENRRPVRGLDKDQFRILEDGAPQQILTFGSGDGVGDVVLALDASGSMSPAVGELRSAARAFLGALPRTQRVTVVAFNTAIQVIAMPEASAAAHVAALDRLAPAGSTAIYDVLIEAVRLFPATSERRTVVMFTDGEDVSSRSSAQSARVALQTGNVVLYVIAQGKAASDRALRDQLSRLATETGGAALVAPKMSQTRGHFADIADELSNQYMLGYIPTRPFANGEWRVIRVETTNPSTKYTVRAREGYLAVSSSER